ncbi:unnamed protein product [Polarella glacialis]|uniref:RING-type domain-containing protein n=1 Tax=Polarella glacialis TaxID=89957 RepID=A0A813G5M5_POLGL|nr:unnamed protein product [Polarella glacialis]
MVESSSDWTGSASDVDDAEQEIPEPVLSGLASSSATAAAQQLRSAAAPRVAEPAARRAAPAHKAAPRTPPLLTRPSPVPAPKAPPAPKAAQAVAKCSPGTASRSRGSASPQAAQAARPVFSMEQRIAQLNTLPAAHLAAHAVAAGFSFQSQEVQAITALAQAEWVAQFGNAEGAGISSSSVAGPHTPQAADAGVTTRSRAREIKGSAKVAPIRALKPFGRLSKESRRPGASSSDDTTAAISAAFAEAKAKVEKALAADKKKRKALDESNQEQLAELHSERAARRKLEQEVGELRTRIKCAICLDRDRSVVLQPCFHLVSCPECQDRVKTCPLCRATTEGRLRVRLS